MEMPRPRARSRKLRRSPRLSAKIPRRRSRLKSPPKAHPFFHAPVSAEDIQTARTGESAIRPMAPSPACPLVVARGRRRTIPLAFPSLVFSFVIPAKAGIQGCKSVLVALDPGFRRGDEKNGPEYSKCDRLTGNDRNDAMPSLDALTPP